MIWPLDWTRPSRMCCPDFRDLKRSPSLNWLNKWKCSGVIGEHMMQGGERLPNTNSRTCLLKIHTWISGVACKNSCMLMTVVRLLLRKMLTRTVVSENSMEGLLIYQPWLRKLIFKRYTSGCLTRFIYIYWMLSSLPSTVYWKQIGGILYGIWSQSFGTGG